MTFGVSQADVIRLMIFAFIVGVCAGISVTVIATWLFRRQPHTPPYYLYPPNTTGMWNPPRSRTDETINTAP